MNFFLHDKLKIYFQFTLLKIESQIEIHKSN